MEGKRNLERSVERPRAQSKELIIRGGCGSQVPTRKPGRSSVQIVSWPRENLASTYTGISFIGGGTLKQRGTLSPKNHTAQKKFGCLYGSRISCRSRSSCIKEQYTLDSHLIMPFHYPTIKPIAPSPSRDTVTSPSISLTSPPDRSNTSTIDFPTLPRDAVTGIEPMFATRTSVVE